MTNITILEGQFARVDDANRCCEGARKQFPTHKFSVSAAGEVQVHTKMGRDFNNAIRWYVIGFAEGVRSKG